MSEDLKSSTGSKKSNLKKPSVTDMLDSMTQKASTDKRSSLCEDFKLMKRTNKGKVDSSEMKKMINLASEPHINQISCNQTQEYFAVATNVGFEII